METQFQHLTKTQRNEMIELLHKFEELFNGTLGTCKKDPVYFKFEIKCGANMLATISSTEGTQENVKNEVERIIP